MNLTLRQLRAFSAVARVGSFTAAARVLNLSQSAVSMLVLQIEDELGLPLFDRTRNGVRPTEAGLELLPIARRMLDDLQLFERSTSDLRALRGGVLRVVAPELLACTLIARELASFNARFPEIALRLVDGTADDVVAAVRRGDAELGFGPERPIGDDVSRSFLRDVPIRLACAAHHPLARRKAASWRDLRDERWVLYPGAFSRELELRLRAHDASLVLQPAAEVGHLTTVLALVGAGVGVAAVPDYARAFEGHFQLAFVPLRLPAINREYFVYRRRGLALSPAAEAFIAEFQASGSAATTGAREPAPSGRPAPR